MAAFILKAIISIFAFLTWAYAGGTFQESLFIGMMLFGILLLRPVVFQSREEREQLLEKERQNREKIKELYEARVLEKKDISHAAIKRQQRSEKKKIES